MKRLVLLFLLVFVSACTAYPENEVYECKIDPYDMFGDYTMLGSYSVVLTAERGYITEEAITIEIPVNQSIEAWIEREFAGDRSAFLKRISVMYRQSDREQLETAKFIEEDGVLYLNENRKSKPLPDDWRSWIIPSERNMEVVKAFYNYCK